MRIDITFMDFSTLSTLRRGKQMTQAAMAKRLGISRALMGRYENGEATPRLDLVEQWCNELGCEIIIKIK